jgi:hypothetical protein
MKTALTVADFQKEKQMVKSSVAFDWNRKLEARLTPGENTGATYVAILGVDGMSTSAHTFHVVQTGSGSPSQFSPTCAETMRIKIAGSMSFSVPSLTATQVTAAAKNALAFELNVNPSLIEVTATESRRLRSDSRRLAGTWTVDYVVNIGESKSTSVQQAVAALSTNTAAFQPTLVSSLVEEAEAAGIVLDTSSVNIVSVSSTKKCLTGERCKVDVTVSTTMQVPGTGSQNQTGVISDFASRQSASALLALFIAYLSQ